MFRMQYPNIKGNDLCDGQIHNISPYTVSQIEDLELFLLEYYDEKYSCDCSTLLHRTDAGLKKIPLLNYDLLFEMIDSGKINLKSIDLQKFLLESNSNNNLNNSMELGNNGNNNPPIIPIIPTEQPVRDFPKLLTKIRAALILYIDNNKNIYFKMDNKFRLVNGELLLKLMQAYDIEWHRKETNELASDQEIRMAISNTMGHILRPNKESDGLYYEERYKIGNIRHYLVGYLYTNEQGIKRGSISI